VDGLWQAAAVGEFRGIELDGVEIETGRLLLRPWRPEDADRVAEVMTDPRMHEFLALPDPYTADDARFFVTEMAVAPRREGTGISCALVERPGGRIVGSALLRLGEEPEVGYWVAGDAQGNGYAAEASAALAGWAFTVGLPRVALLCHVGNVASARTALAAGFRFEGLCRNAFAGGGYATVPERRGDLARFARLADDPPGPVAPAFPPLADDAVHDGTLALRPARRDDAAQLEECEDELTARWGFTGEPKSAAEVQAAAARAQLDWLVGAMAFFAMVDLATGRVAGSVQLRKAGPPHVGGVGYVVHPAFRGRGYATRALRLLAPWAFDVAGFARLELGAKVDNVASVRVAENAGWEPDGIRRGRLRNGDGTFSDEQRYALLAPEPAR